MDDDGGELLTRSVEVPLSGGSPGEQHRLRHKRLNGVKVGWRPVRDKVLGAGVNRPSVELLLLRHPRQLKHIQGPSGQSWYT